MLQVIMSRDTLQGSDCERLSLTLLPLAYKFFTNPESK